MQWYRMWSEVLHDKKLARVQRDLGLSKGYVLGWWTALLSIASESPDRGRLLIGNRCALSAEDLPDIMGESIEDCHRMLSAFCKFQLLTRTGKVYVVVNWNKRQPESDDVAKRVLKHRSRSKCNVTETLPVPECNVTETLLKRYCNVLDTDTDTDTENRPSSSTVPEKVAKPKPKPDGDEEARLKDAFGNVHPYAKQTDWEILWSLVADYGIRMVREQLEDCLARQIFHAPVIPYVRKACRSQQAQSKLSNGGNGQSDDLPPNHVWKEANGYPWRVLLPTEDAMVFNGKKIGDARLTWLRDYCDNHPEVRREATNGHAI